MTNTNTNTERVNAILYFKNRENKITTLKDGLYEATLKSYTVIEDNKTPRVQLELTLNKLKYTKTIFDSEFLAMCRELQRQSDTTTSNPFDTLDSIIKKKTKFNIWLKTVTVETKNGWAERQNWLYKEPVEAPKTTTETSKEDEELLKALDAIEA